MTDYETLELPFTKIAENIPGAEGPVFDKDGVFYVVAPEVMDGSNNAGQILKVDLETGAVHHLKY